MKRFALPPGFKWLKNKYFISSILMLSWLAFFDRFDLMSQYRLQKTLQNLKAEKNFYEKEISLNRNTIDELNNNPEKREKFGREKYLMKKNDEDIFLIIDTLSQSAQ
ncbi:MAG: FtsB family cell division protein [Bacteroidota bacterium]|jgi:cell division protein FtsB